MAESLNLDSLTLQQALVDARNVEAHDDGIPARLSKDFLWSASGTEHVNYSANEQFEGDTATVGRSGHLGSGGFGSVDAVICKGQIMARKRMHFPKLDVECEREAKILEGIVHRHIIQFVGSYTQQKRFYLLLHPVAECNLKEYMQTSEHERDLRWEQNLKSAFGCLAAAVAFLHSTKIAVKHKDIKPSNVLMFCGTPMLTDFGLSNSFKGAEDSRSSGFTGKTTMYAAPEAVNMLPRGTSQDVFSLGLVFQDMYWTMQGHSDGLQTDLEGNKRDGSSYSGQKLLEQDRKFSKEIPLLAFQWDSEIQDKKFLIQLMRLMTAETPEDRPTAATVWQALQVPAFYGTLCGRCCHENLPRLDQETTDRVGWTRFPSESSSTVTSLHSNNSRNLMLSYSNLPPHDGTNTTYLSVPSTNQPPMSEYEKITG